MASWFLDRLRLKTHCCVTWVSFYSCPYFDNPSIMQCAQNAQDIKEWLKLKEASLGKPLYILTLSITLNSFWIAGIPAGGAS